MEELFLNNDLELFDTESDPFEMDNLARDPRTHGELIVMMNTKLNQLLENEVGGLMMDGCYSRGRRVETTAISGEYPFVVNNRAVTRPKQMMTKN